MGQTATHALDRNAVEANQARFGGAVRGAGDHVDDILARHRFGRAAGRCYPRHRRLAMRMRSVMLRSVGRRKIGRFQVVISSLSLIGVPMAGTENPTALSAITPRVAPAAGQETGELAGPHGASVGLIGSGEIEACADHIGSGPAHIKR